MNLLPTFRKTLGWKPEDSHSPAVWRCGCKNLGTAFVSWFVSCRNRSARASLRRPHQTLAFSGFKSLLDESEAGEYIRIFRIVYRNSELKPWFHLCGSLRVCGELL